jgi:hypothetical protein
MAKAKVVGIYGWVVDGVVRYIGHATDMYDSRKSNHLSKMRHGKHTKKMNKLWDEVGDESKFEFVKIEECLVHDLLVREKYYKDFYKDTICNTYDIKKTKKFFRTGLNSRKQKEKFSETMSGENNPNCRNEIETIIAIKYLLENTDMTNNKIAELYNQNKSLISMIRTKKRWKSVVVPVGYEYM